MAGIIELLSIGLTLPTIILSAWVVVIYAPSMIKELAHNGWMKFSNKAESMLLLGVVLGFIADFFDNTYWGIAWTANYLHLDAQTFLFSNGYISNFVFRQGLGVLSAICHLAFVLHKSKTARGFNKLIWILAGVFAGTLYYMRNGLTF